MLTEMEKMEEAHICKGRLIRKCPSVLCSLCRGDRAVKVTMTEKEINEHNIKIVNSLTWSDISHK